MVDRINPENKIKQAEMQLNNMRSYPSFGLDFRAELKKQMDKAESVQFSKHAMERIESRGIDVSLELVSDLNNAVAKAREKGARDVVVIGKSEAFIVNIQNNVVITAMSEGEMKNNISTNIDSAVIL